jgi:hypothetical protein
MSDLVGYVRPSEIHDAVIDQHRPVGMTVYALAEFNSEGGASRL